VNSSDQVILVLQLLLTIGPLAAYFLGLGLVSSRAHPCLVSERADFVLLTLAFVPVISWPLVSLLSTARYVPAAGLVAVLATLFCWLLPRGEGGWVIYNLSGQELRRALQRACGRLGWRIEYTTATGDEPEATVQPAGLTLTTSNMPWLRNITLRCKVATRAEADARRELLHALAGELRKESMLPSPTGAGLVVVGALLLGLPTWYFFHHIDAIVDVVRRVLPA
jgi:hypothetical protein